MLEKVRDWFDKVEEFCEDHEMLAYGGIMLIVGLVTVIPALITSVVIEKIKVGAK